MNCPICRTPMVVFELNQVEVDHCTRCGGVWLDAEEMDLLLDGSTGRDEIRRQLIVAEPDSGEKRVRCPICRRKMEKARAQRPGMEKNVVIDRCHRGHGTWLDGGELQAIVELSQFPAAHRIHEFLTAIFREPARGGRP